MSDEYFEEEDFQTKFTGKTFRRIIGLTKPYWKWVAGFIIAIALVSGLDSFFTFLSKRIIDEGILGKNIPVLKKYLNYLRILARFTVRICFHIYLPGWRFG